MTTSTTEHTGTILIADDEESLRWVLEQALVKRGHRVESVADGRSAWEALESGRFDVALLDIRMPGLAGLDVLTRVREREVDTLCIVMTAESTMANAIEATKRGAYDYLPKPFELDAVHLLVQRALTLRKLARDVARLRGELRQQQDALIGSAPAMQEVFKLIGRVAPTEATVLIEGETGTGKELVAKTIHAHSDRAGPFLALNCSAIPAELLESELFGHERGAFTGAVDRRTGKFEQAAGGTLFLDEIGDLPLPLQAKLLRVLQEREFTRLGGQTALAADVRIVAATNRDLEAATRRGEFREDLFFRLNVMRLRVPPLRDRREDIPALIDHFLDKMRRQHGLSVIGVSDDARRLLVGASWPGNVRQLENTLLRAAVLAGGTRPLLPEDFDLAPALAAAPAPPASLAAAVEQRVSELLHGSGPRVRDLHAQLLAEVERPMLRVVLAHTGGNQLRAADVLGINRNTLRKKLTDLDIPVSRGREPS
ncbi:MAG TPA: sigma-54 dependent transcriptional regulator [Candidatus Limnocylindria bacterium]|nr:sigma-54 dependent transcriptional regulator [Candidatus Limnocylindria bacterium]